MKKIFFIFTLLLGLGVLQSCSVSEECPAYGSIKVEKADS